MHDLGEEVLSPQAETEDEGFAAAWLGTSAQPSPGVEPSENGNVEMGLWSGSRAASAPFEHAIAPGLRYNPTITRGGDPIPSNAFGLTYVDRSQYAYSNEHIRKFGTFYFVNADVEQQIYWDVRHGTGWDQQVNISGASDPSIRQGNFRRVATDLVPNVFGRPPRTGFWAEDLTIKHEQVHVTQLQRFTREAIGEAETWLSQKRASSETGVRALLAQAIDGIDRRVDRQSKRETRNENEAHSSVAPDYRARARAIRARGRAGGYPP